MPTSSVPSANRSSDADSARVLDEPRAVNEAYLAAVRSNTGVQRQKAATAASPMPGARRSDALRLLPAIDAIGVILAWLLAYLSFSPDAEGFGRLLVRATGLAGFAFLLASHSRLYDAVTISDQRVEAARVLRIGLGTGLLVLSAPLFTQGTTYPVRAVAGGVLSAFVVGTARLLLHAWLHHERAGGRHLQAVAVVAYREEAERLIQLLNNRPDLGLRVTCLAGDWETAFKHDLNWVGWPRDTAEAVAVNGLTGAVISPTGMLTAEFNQAAQDLARLGIDVYCSTGLEGVGHGRLRPTSLANESFYSLAAPELSATQLLAKRVLDLSVASLTLLLAAPVMALTALAIKLSDRGPIFFRQVRIGRDGQSFTVFKFRTMVVDAEARLAELRSQNARGGPLFKVASDPRVTRIGRLLRVSSLDELPQLFNVLNGSMSLVGPRPALPSEVATFDQRHLSRHRVPPGVTGLWQVEARDNPSFEAYRHLDVFYVENWSIGLDLVLLWSTLPAIVTRAVRSLLFHRQDLCPAPVEDRTEPAVQATAGPETVLSPGA